MRSPALRFATLVFLVVIGLVLAYKLGLVEWLQEGALAERVLALRGKWWTPLALVGLLVLAGSLPLPATAAVLISGAVYGPWRGWMLSLLGCLLASLGGYLLSRALGRDFAVRILGPKRWSALDGLMQEHGFWAMVRARWMLPLLVPNYAAGIGGMKALPFMLSSLVGMAVPTALYSRVGHLLLAAPSTDPARTLSKAAAIVLAMLVVSMAGPALRYWRRRRSAGTENN